MSTEKTTCHKILRTSLRNSRKKGSNEEYRERVITWGKQPSFVRIERPTNLLSARSKGYKPKQGVILVRARVRKGSFRKRSIKGGRRPKRMGITKRVVNMSLQNICELRVARKRPNCEVLNSYWVGKTGKCEYFEVILVDRSNTAVQADRDLRTITHDRGRVFRGKTAAKKRTNK